MSKPPYDDARIAEAYRHARELPREGLGEWRTAIERHLSARPDGTVLDLGAGTGGFATALADWFGIDVVAVEPAPAMRELIPAHPRLRVLDGRAEALPLPDGCADGAWLSMVVQHLADLPAAARELRRVLRPRATVLIRNVFPGRCDGLAMVRFFPETRAVVDTFPTVEETCAAFGTAGFARVALTTVPQRTVPSAGAFARRLRREADTLLRGLTDEEFARGVERLAAAARRESQPGGTAEPVVTRLDLLVLR